MFADMMGMLVSPYLELKSCIMAAVLTAGSYLASIYFVQRKTRKVDAVECTRRNSGNSCGNKVSGDRNAC